MDVKRKRGQYVHNILDSVKSCQTSVKICISETHSCLSIVTPWRPLGSNVGGGFESAVSISLSNSSSLGSQVSCASFILCFRSPFVAVMLMLPNASEDALQPKRVEWAQLRGAMKGVARTPFLSLRAPYIRMRSRNENEGRKRSRSRKSCETDGETRKTRGKRQKTGRRERQGDSQEKAVCSAPRGLASGEQTIANAGAKCHDRKDRTKSKRMQRVTINLHMLMVNHGRDGLEEPKPLEKGKGKKREKLG